jgi:hypothetical protein
MSNSFDIDGVIYMGEYGGVYPGPSDIIITGRCFEEEIATRQMLAKKGITNPVFFNKLPFDKKTRKSSGEHKAQVLNSIKEQGGIIELHFEDDPIQARVIKKLAPHVQVVLLKHDLVEKENVWHEPESEV